MFFDTIYNFKSYLILTSSGFMCGFVIFYIFNITNAVYLLIFIIIFQILLLIHMVIRIICKKSVSKLCILSILFTVSLLLGFLRIGIDEYKYQSFNGKFGYGTTVFYGTVISEPESGMFPDYKSAYVQIASYIDDGITLNSSARVKLYYTESSYEKIKYLDNIEFCGQIQKTDEKYILNERSQNVSAIIKTKTCIKSDNESSILIKMNFSETLHRKIVDAINAVFYYNPKRASIITGILTGSKLGFSPKMYQGFSDAGFMHIAAVSGMHVSILLSIISFVLGTLRLDRKIVTIITIPLLFVFCAVADFTASSLRAAIMLSLALVSMFVNREYDMKTALFLSAFLILMVYPYKLFTASFLLSFGATLGIALFYAPINKILKKYLGKIFVPSFLLNGISLSLSAFLGTAPFCTAFFGNLNLIACLTNIWIIPVVTVIFCLGILSCVTYYIFPHIALNVLIYLCEPFLMITAETADLFYNTGIGIIEFDYVPTAFYGFYIAFILVLYKLIKRA